MIKYALPFVMIACTSSDEAKLDHAQILAVRAEPAHVAPLERARIDILAGDDAGNVFEVSPDTLVTSLAVEHTDAGWFVTAGPAPEIATLSVTLSIDGISWPATKSLVVSERAENPTFAMTIDGIAVTEMTAHVGTVPALAAIAEGTAPFTYAWYSSVGDLSFIHSANATLDATAPADGTLVAVVRDDVGGVTWQVVPARIE